MGNSYSFGVPGAGDGFEIQSLGVNVAAPASVGTIATAPPNSASVAVSLGTPVQNNLGYDALLTVYVKITAATAATILAGVSASSSPPTNPYVSSDSLTGIVPITMYVPNKYYAVVTTTGTITDSATGMWCPV